MTKKLSEIGKEVPSTEEFACMNAAAENNFIVFTPAERRELVRRAWSIGYDVHKAEAANLGQILTFEKYCEEQGI